jgi:hypothetical protein
MDEMIAYCGLSCRTCPIYLASGEIDEIKKNNLIESIIRECKEHYGIEYKPEDISDCDGCKSHRGKIFSGCENCNIRICARRNNIENCAFCDEYVCEMLSELFKSAPEAKKYLDIIHKNIRHS